MNIPLIYAELNKKYVIDKIHLKDDLAKHMMDLGFNKKAELKISQKTKDGLIVEIHGAKIALGKDVAQKIYVKELEKENGLEA